MNKKDKTIRILKEVEEIISQVICWGTVANLFFLIPFSFFTVMSVGVCFTWSCVLLALVIANHIIRKIRIKLMKSSVENDLETIKKALKEKLAELLREDILEAEAEAEEEKCECAEEDNQGDNKCN